MRVLVVEDEVKLGGLLKRGLWRAFRRHSSRTPPSASPEPTRRARSRAPGSGSRSPRPWRAPTVARRLLGTSPAAPR